MIISEERGGGDQGRQTDRQRQRGEWGVSNQRLVKFIWCLLT